MDRDELSRRACQGDIAARDEIGEWLNDELAAYFASKRFSREEVDELVQETMVDVWAKAHRQNPADADALLDWVLSFAGTIRRAAIGERKREHARARMRERLDEPAPPRSPGSEVLLLQQRELLVACLRRLPTMYRNAVQHRLDDGDDAAMAEREGITVGALRVRVSRGLKMLERLGQDARVTPSTGS